MSDDKTKELFSNKLKAYVNGVGYFNTRYMGKKKFN